MNASPECYEVMIKAEHRAQVCSTRGCRVKVVFSCAPEGLLKLTTLKCSEVGSISASATQTNSKSTEAVEDALKLTSTD